ncbi:PHP domain-containing protein [Frankia sp. CNm7]|uniref:PHP domain-containing protein n=1 Tax=Frankia nepalensis TaxID=1836974 RepID=A0A937RJH7_9ACTN|nr:PHP domain-containing protein [Frankia nepalensis]MBL7501376.1 PHP domain-containing protein [Frankia nepalensis]MBL7514805.1 PHP domain-containing protein [Frankia nepalensis]MBL7517803.1 PHP domain-containing protein [Frankia nepalensis]MBL7628494.1 PHP domain-containing protein [Frankia nepalensis]
MKRRGTGPPAWNGEAALPGIDLHTHSTASDGLLAPAALVAAAAEAGLSTIALTDHDTTGGMAAAEAALRPGMTLVPGAEISCEVRVAEDRVISLHVLGYLFDPAEPGFAAVRARLRGDRERRARRMVDLIAADGHPVTWERVEELAGGTVGRPHIAAALLEAGLVADFDEAFTPDWIGGRASRYWAGKEQPDVAEALRLIHQAGGVSVFAHPFAAARGPIVEPEVIEEMARLGLAGVEADHPDHPPAARARLRALAADLGLLVTGSSDFHGTRNGPGRGIGANGTAPAVLAEIADRATGDAPRARAA